MGKTIYIDIDGTICRYEGSVDYNLAIPYKDRIEKINKLYDEGNRIHYWTSRGVETNEYWLGKTKDQLDSWGCKYHGILINKPVYDLFIDDKNIKSEDFFKN